jgi:hypothetical protein
MTKTETILVRVHPDLLAKAKELAAAQDRPLAQLIRELLREKIAEEEKAKSSPTK